MRKMLICAALLLSTSLAHAEKSTSTTVADVCLSVANVCTTTCSLSVPNTGSFSADLNSILTCNEKCADSYRQCVSGLERKALRQSLRNITNAVIADP